jgi:outer membrane protein OmpA-like peptidoglycan-associated protein
VGLHDSDTGQVSEIAYYLQQNPSLKAGIYASSPSSDARNQDLASQRLSTIYWALVKAGVPAERIETGALGDAQLARDQRVEVLLRTR